MGKTMVIYRVTPTDMGKLDETVGQVKDLKAGRVVDVKKEPIGFGITVLKVGVVVEKEEAVEKATAELSALPLVEEAEQQEMTLL
jgi:translation elongation factor EF-1beta